MTRNCDNEEGDLNKAYLFPRILGYKRRSDILEGGIIEVKVYMKFISSHFPINVTITIGHILATLICAIRLPRMISRRLIWDL